MKEANKIAELIKVKTDIDIFENKRTTAHAEYRSLFCFILRKYFRMTLYQIRDYFISKGKNYDHATVLYAVNKFEFYRQFNKQIEPLLYHITKKHINPNARNFKRGILSHKIDYIEDKYVDSLLDIVEKLPFKELAKKNN